MTVSLVVTTSRQAASLAKVLASLEGQASLLTELVITEDGDDPSTAATVDQFAPKLATSVYHVSSAWDGFRLAESRNRGLRLVTADYVIQLDGDCVVHPQFVSDHVRTARTGRFLQGQRATIAVHTVIGFSHRFWTRWRYVASGAMAGRKYGIRIAPRFDATRDFRCAFGCNMSFYMEDLVRINGYDLTMVGWGGEDYDIAGRLSLIGVRPLVMYRAGIIYHLDHPRRSDPSPHRKYLDADERVSSGLFRPERGLRETAPGIVRLVASRSGGVTST